MSLNWINKKKSTATFYMVLIEDLYTKERFGQEKWDARGPYGSVSAARGVATKEENYRNKYSKATPRIRIVRYEANAVSEEKR